MQNFEAIEQMFQAVLWIALALISESSDVVLNQISLSLPPPSVQAGHVQTAAFTQPLYGIGPYFLQDLRMLTTSELTGHA